MSATLLSCCRHHGLTCLSCVEFPDVLPSSRLKLLVCGISSELLRQILIPTLSSPPGVVSSRWEASLQKSLVAICHRLLPRDLSGLSTSEDLPSRRAGPPVATLIDDPGLDNSLLGLCRWISLFCRLTCAPVTRWPCPYDSRVYRPWRNSLVFTLRRPSSHDATGWNQRRKIREFSMEYLNSRPLMKFPKSYSQRANTWERIGLCVAWGGGNLVFGGRRGLDKKIEL